MVGHGDRRHLERLHLLNERIDLIRTVQKAVLSVQMKVNELLGRQGGRPRRGILIGREGEVNESHAARRVSCWKTLHHIEQLRARRTNLNVMEGAGCLDAAGLQSTEEPRKQGLESEDSPKAASGVVLAFDNATMEALS
jgi:hypothetical protein